MSCQIKWVYQTPTTTDKNRSIPKQVTRNIEHTAKGRTSSFQREHKTGQIQRTKNKMAPIVK